MKDPEKFSPESVGADITSGDIATVIYSRMKQHSFARQNKYTISFELPPDVKTDIDKRSPSIDPERFKKIKFNCSRLSSPGRSIEKSSINNSAHDNIIALIGSTDNIISASFICSADLKEKVLFEYWLDYIYDFDAREVEFLDKYSTDIIVSQMDAQHTGVYSIKMEKAFPTTLQSVQYDYQANNMPIMFDINFTYSYIRTYDYPQQ